MNLNGKPVSDLTDTGTIGGTLISNRFLTTHNILYKARRNPITLIMAVKGSQSTSNFSVEAMIQLGKMKVDRVPIFVMLGSDPDIIGSIHDLIRLGAVIDCQKNRI